MKTLKEMHVEEAGREAKQDAGGAHPDQHGDNCRCKEVSEMSPRELLRTMMNDLAFWKKGKKERN